MLKVSVFSKLVRQFCSKVTREMKYLNVAEKHDAAKTIAGFLSNGASHRREGLSVYNKVFDFESTVRGQKVKMVMTSVSGHLLSLEFPVSYKSWRNVNPLQLFDAPVRKFCSEDYQPIKRTLEKEIRGCQGLIIWTDCDREGENIGFEIIDVCRTIKPNIAVYRAKFSEITSAGVRRALANLVQPDELQSKAVDIRTELDLRTGAAFTRFQTLRLQRLFPESIADKLISYGSCQIPTLGFVVERYKEVEAFISEPFWKIKVIHTIDDLSVEFLWARNRLFDQDACEDYLMLCLADPQAKVDNVTVKPKNKWRPVAMDTVELEKLGSRKLKLSAKETMTIAEKLYTKGLISYPRTETNSFSSEIDLKSLVQHHVPHPDWGAFATRVLNWGPTPRNGNKSDQAHPPIHPTKLAPDISGNEGRVYELIVRHFLACVSKDATGSETVVNITIAGEKFTATGLCIYERNYLDVYPYEKWNAKQIHRYEINSVFDPTEISMQEGATTAPPLLTEADLIVLMDKHGIGTDATHAEHINTIKERGYIGVADRGCLVPGVIGMGLYEGYDAMDLALAKPMLRAEFENDLKKICAGEKDSQAVLSDQIIKYKEAYRLIVEKVSAMDEKIASRLNETPKRGSADSQDTSNENQFYEMFKCPKCSDSHMALKIKKNKASWFIACLNFPDCKNTVWLPDEIKEVSVVGDCSRCGADSKKLKIKFKTMYYRAMFNVPTDWYITCLKCDSKLREAFNINLDQIKRLGGIVGESNAQAATSTSTGNVISNYFTSNSSTSATVRRNIASSLSLSSARITGTSSGTNNQPKRNRDGSVKPPTTKKPRATKKTKSTLSVLSATNNSDNFFGDDGFDEILLETDFSAVENSNAASSNNYGTTFESTDAENIDWENIELDDWDTGGLTSNANNEAGPSISSWGSGNQSNNQRSGAIQSGNSHRDNQSSSWGTGSRNQSNTNQSDNYRWENPSSSRGTYRSGNNPGALNIWGSSGQRNDVTNNSQRGLNAENSSANQPPSHDVQCTGCNTIAKQLTVKKDGPNKGRIFYTCSKPSPCKFFQWDDEDLKNVTEVRSVSTFTPTQPTDDSANTDTSENVVCKCQAIAKSLTVRKEGPNKGRPFYICPNEDKSCGFFQWGDENTSPNNQSASSTSTWGSQNQTSGWGSGGHSSNRRVPGYTAPGSAPYFDIPHESRGYTRLQKE